MNPEPIQDEHPRLMNMLAHAIDEALNGPRQPGIPPRIGFVLLVSEFGQIEGGRVNYISNGERDSMLAMCREYLARAEGRYHEPKEGLAQ
ncbi:hypothetical protein SAMN05444722_1716 [Rhodovulum sp. ES.010]|uniref:hypothetical protein n=1 Tax=Rhodovulum sp. ES.010 TaxID=1882821 RepID=UPI000928784C|nr:hypothetical protein [Rhodovulum sp. ES.010]SIO36972.1 hypothetical protein SAMN05444722_1716 [Rhodovulum sp. ES.010]